MPPTLQNNDLVLSDRITHRFQYFQRGSLILFKVNRELENQGLDDKLNYIRRVVGLPGETFEILQGQLYINGKLFQADYLAILPIDKSEEVNIEIPAKHYLVLGKDASNGDKLQIVLVPKKQILGKVVFRIWPPERFGRVK